MFTTEPISIPSKIPSSENSNLPPNHIVETSPIATLAKNPLPVSVNENKSSLSRSIHKGYQPYLNTIAELDVESLQIDLAKLIQHIGSLFNKEWPKAKQKSYNNSSARACNNEWLIEKVEIDIIKKIPAHPFMFLATFIIIKLKKESLLPDKNKMKQLQIQMYDDLHVRTIALANFALSDIAQLKNIIRHSEMPNQNLKEKIININLQNENWKKEKFTCSEIEQLQQFLIDINEKELTKKLTQHEDIDKNTVFYNQFHEWIIENNFSADINKMAIRLSGINENPINTIQNYAYALEDNNFKSEHTQNIRIPIKFEFMKNDDLYKEYNHSNIYVSMPKPFSDQLDKFNIKYTPPTKLINLFELPHEKKKLLTKISKKTDFIDKELNKTDEQKKQHEEKKAQLIEFKQKLRYEIEDCKTKAKELKLSFFERFIVEEPTNDIENFIHSLVDRFAPEYKNKVKEKNSLYEANQVNIGKLQIKYQDNNQSLSETEQKSKTTDDQLITLIDRAKKIVELRAIVEEGEFYETHEPVFHMEADTDDLIQSPRSSSTASTLVYS